MTLLDAALRLAPGLAPAREANEQRYGDGGWMRVVDARRILLVALTLRNQYCPRAVPILAVEHDEGVTMAPTMIHHSTGELREEKRRLLSAFGLTGRQLKDLAAQDELTGDQWDAYERLRELNFLLKGAKRAR